MMSFNAPITSQGTVPPPSSIGISGVLPGQSAVNTTRILSLTGFSKELKTRDIQNIFVDYEDDRGGYRIKWLDDTGCLIVFSDPLTAKRAFLQLLASPHPHLIPSTSAEGEPVVPLLRPYVSTTEEVTSVISSVANRPRSRSIASNNNVNSSPGNTAAAGGHARRMSNSSMHARGGSLASSQNGASSERRTFSGRPSFGQGQMQAIMDEANQAKAASANSESALDARSPSPKDQKIEGGQASGSGGAIDWGNVASSQGGNGNGNRARRPSAAGIGGGQTFSPPVSPERGMRAGATSPSSLRRLIQQRG